MFLMIKALLFDLDDTLLSNDMGTFIPAYFQALTQHLEGVDPDQLLHNLVSGSRAMLDHADPTQPVLSAFAARFSPGMNWAEAAWKPRFETFFRNGGYGRLRSITSARPAARAVLDWAFGAGYRVVVATSPLFPLAAIEERLRWANVADYPFEFITHAENSHFTKPHPEYFAEILARLGLRPTEALMIGNDWSDDMAPSALLGLSHYWIAPLGSSHPIAPANPVGIGDLSQFLSWAQTHLATFQPPSPPPTSLPYQLSGHLAAASGILEGLPEPGWKMRPSENEWSLTEVVCHLRDAEREVNLPRVQSIIVTENPFISGAVTDPWAVERNYQAQDGLTAWQAFAAARQETIAVLGDQPPDVWSRPARHALFGPSTLAEIVGWALDHDRIHLDQLRTTRQRVTAATPTIPPQSQLPGHAL
jgi:FMN phosphatase YigB (HAD superfamily)